MFSALKKGSHPKQAKAVGRIFRTHCTAVTGWLRKQKEAPRSWSLASADNHDHSLSITAHNVGGITGTVAAAPIAGCYGDALHLFSASACGIFALGRPEVHCICCCSTGLDAHIRLLCVSQGRSGQPAARTAYQERTYPPSADHDSVLY